MPPGTYDEKFRILHYKLELDQKGHPGAQWPRRSEVQINYKENFGTKRDVILFSLSLMLLYWIQKDLKILSTLTTLEASAKSSVRSPGQACYHLILLFHSVGIRIGRHLGPNSTLSRFDHIDTRILLSFDKYIKYLYNLH